MGQPSSPTRSHFTKLKMPGSERKCPQARSRLCSNGAVDKVSVASSEYHDCLPATAEEAFRQGYAAAFCPGPGDCVVIRTTWRLRMRRTLQPLRPWMFATDLARIPDQVQAREVLTLAHLFAKLPTSYPWGDIVFNTQPVTEAGLRAVRNTLGFFSLVFRACGESNYALAVLLLALTQTFGFISETETPPWTPCCVSECASPFTQLLCPASPALPSGAFCASTARPSLGPLSVSLHAAPQSARATTWHSAMRQLPQPVVITCTGNALPCVTALSSLP